MSTAGGWLPKNGSEWFRWIEARMREQERGNREVFVPISQDDPTVVDASRSFGILSGSPESLVSPGSVDVPVADDDPSLTAPTYGDGPEYVDVDHSPDSPYTPLDEEPPPQPSKPIMSVRLGVVSAMWDGLAEGANSMSDDFAYLEVHRSQQAPTAEDGEFYPNAETYYDRLYARGSIVMPEQEYNSVWYYRFVAVDSSGNRSEPSFAATATTTPLVDTDIIGKVLDGANFMDGTIDTAALADGSISASKVAQDAIDAIVAEFDIVGAGGVITTFAPTAPASPALNHVWYDTDDNNKGYRWDGDSWEPLSSVASAGSGGTTNYYQNDPPPGTGHVIGSTWFDQNDGYKPYRWDGDSWEPYVFGTSALDPLLDDNILATAAADAQVKATTAQTNAIAASIPRIITVGTNKTFYPLFTYSSNAGNQTGSIVIDTPITFSNYMSRVEIGGFNYVNGKNEVDVVTGFYAYSVGPLFAQSSQTSMGSAQVTVRLARKVATNTVSIILDIVGGVWQYPKISVERVDLGQTLPPDSFLTGWSGSLITSTTGYDLIVTPTRRDLDETNALTQSWRTTGQTTIDGGKVTADSITALQIAANAITATEILAGAVTTVKLDALAVTAEKIAANAIIAGKIAADAVTTNTIAANAVTAAKIAANTITANEIAAGAITADELAANAVVAGKIAAGAVTAGTIAANAVTAGTIAADAVTSGTIAAGAITAGKIAALAVTAGTIAANAVGTNELAANSVVAGKIAANAVTAGTIAALAVTAGTIAANAVTTDTIDAGAITAEKIALGVLKRNLVNDPGFEEEYAFTRWDPFGTGQGNLDQWRIQGPPAASPDPVRETVVGKSRGGRSALSLTITANGQNNLAISNAFPVTVGKTYRVLVHAVSLGTEQTMSVGVEKAATKAGMTGFAAETLTGDSTWANPVLATEPIAPEAFEVFSYTYTATEPWNAVRVGNFGSAAAGTVRIDDISVVEVGAGGASELTPAGLRLFDDGGNETGAFVSNRPNYFTVHKDNEAVASISGDGVGSFAGLASVADPEFAGTPLLGSFPTFVSPTEHPTLVDSYLDRLPRGVVGTAMLGGGVTYNGGVKGVRELSFRAQAGRTYRVTFSGILVQVATANASCGFQVRLNIPPWTADGSGEAVTPQYNTGSILFHSYARSAVLNTLVTVPARTYILRCNPAGVSGGGELNAGIVKLHLLEISNTSAFTTNGGEMIALTVEDIGPDVPNDGVVNTSASGTSQPTQPAKTTLVKTYTSIASGTYKGDGTKRTDAVDVVQGYQGSNGNQRGVWIFPSMTADLSGATIKRIDVYAYATHWYAYSGGTARIHVHGHTSVPASSPSLTYATQKTGWPRPGGVWVTLPSSLYAGFLSGTYRGFGMGPAPSNSTTYYGRFRGGGGAQIRVYYTK